jgi:hypothetical protein
MYQAVHTCGSVDEWEAAYAEWGDSFMFTARGKDLLTNLCLYAIEVAETSLCNQALRVP